MILRTTTTPQHHQQQSLFKNSQNIPPSHSTNSKMADPAPPLEIDETALNQTWLKACEHGQLPAAQANGLTTGMNRLALNADDKLARDWFVEETRALGCEIKVRFCESFLSGSLRIMRDFKLAKIFRIFAWIISSPVHFTFF